ncbi:MAG: hypothetical protein AB7L94_19670, partial [Kofleriaceae bacterium]
LPEHVEAEIESLMQSIDAARLVMTRLVMTRLVMTRLVMTRLVMTRLVMTRLVTTRPRGPCHDNRQDIVMTRWHRGACAHQHAHAITRTPSRARHHAHAITRTSSRDHQ